MTPQAVRAARVGLVVLVAALVGSVAWTLKTHPAPPPATATAPELQPTSKASPVTQMGDFVHTIYKEVDGQQVKSLEVRAKFNQGSESAGFNLKGVFVSFWYTKYGERLPGLITADECVYTPALQKSVFTGNVHLAADGFDLKTASLIQRGDKNLVKTEDPVQFSRKTMSGSATGMNYFGEEGRLELVKDVVIKIADPDEAPAEIRAGHAESLREEGSMKFGGGVEMGQGNDRLKSQKLLVNFDPTTQNINRAQAVDDVEVWTGTGTGVPGLTSATAGRGPRYLKARKLDMWFRPDGSMQEATAGQDADLTILPAPGEPQEKRRLQARFIVFVFDALGRLEEMRGQKDSSFSAEPLKGNKAPARKILCRNFQAKIDPASGEPIVIDFDKEVSFSEASRQATSDKAYYEGPKSTLFLTGDPVLVDTEQLTELRAQGIDIVTRSGDLSARTGVRHVLRRKHAKGGLLGAGEEPVLVTSRFFDYMAKTRTAHYKEDALLRSGKDEVRAAEIRLTEATDGRRRLEAEGSVISRMQPTSKGTGPQKAANVEGRAQKMVYEEALGRIVYTGEVVIRQGDIVTRSPGATLALTADGTGIETLKAGEPVEVEQGLRRASGRLGVYTPAAETMLLTGEKVVLTDEKQQVEGRSLTFHVGDERVLVDGREEIRTQMIIKQKKQESR